MTGYMAPQHRHSSLPKVAADKLPTPIWDEPAPGRRASGEGNRWLPIIKKLIATPNRWARVNDGSLASRKMREIQTALRDHGYDRADFQFRTTSGVSPSTRGRKEYLFVMYEPRVFHWPGES